MGRLRHLYGKDYEDWHNSQDDLLIYMMKKRLKNKHENLRNILIKSGSKEYGDEILDEICNLFEYPPTWIYYKEGE
jgi:aminopeptidase-like protein